MKLMTTTALVGALCAGTVQAAELRMSWWGGDDRHTATQAALEACGAKHGHEISAEFTGFDGYLEKLTTQMAGGTEADIVQVNWPWMPLFSRDGTGFADLATLEAIDLSQWSEAQLAATTGGGHVHALPVSTSGRVFFFNTTTLAEAGIEPPTTWEGFFSAAATLRETMGEEYRLFNAVKETAQLLVTLHAVQQTGKDLVDPETNRVAWSVEDLADAIAFYGRMVETGAVMSMEDEAAEGNVNLYEKQAWSQGRIAGSYEWDSTYNKYADPLAEGQVIDSFPPLMTEGAVTEGIYRKPSMVFAVSRNADDPEAAAQILNCLLNEPEGIDALGDTRGVPASAVAAERLIEAGTLNPEIVKASNIVAEAEGPTVSPFNEHPEIRSDFLATMEEYAYGLLDAQDAAEIIIDNTNKVLAKFD